MKPDAEVFEQTEAWLDSVSFFETWPGTGSSIESEVAKLRRQLDPWTGSPSQDLDTSVAKAVETGLTQGPGAGGEKGQAHQEVAAKDGLSEEQLRQLTQTDTVGFETDAFIRANPLPSPPGLKAGESQFRPPKELIQMMTGKADLDRAPLIPGLNLLSIPEEPTDSAPAAVLAPIAGSFTRAYAYENCNPTDKWKVYDPNDAAGSDLTVLDHTKGFWLEATSAVDLPFDGTLPPTTSFEICTGWNLIGYPAGQSRHVTNALQSIEGKYVRVFGFDAADAGDPWEVYSVGVPEWGNDLDFMHPGRGYWVLATENATLEIANEGPAPTVAITAPADLEQITAPTEIIGTVQSKILKRWTLDYRALGDPEWIEITTGEAPVTDAALGTFDPTQLVNGMYEIRLQAVDLDSRVVEETIAVVVDGELKIGHFILPLLDMTVPVVGLPFDVARVYDTRDRSVGDFGHGWRLQTSRFKVTENTNPGLGWRGTVSQGPFPTYCIEPVRPHVVLVRFPDDSLARFQARLEPECQPLAPQSVVTLHFVPLAGTRAELDSVDIKGENLIVNGSFPGPVELFNLDTVLPHNPDTYEVTTATNSKVEIDQDLGLQRLTDANGNTMEVSPQGLIHSRGMGVDFTRDPQGRITTITDPSGDVMTYEYNAAGDLVKVTDRVGQIWRYTYHDDHFLNTIIDPNGIEQAAYSYDGDNRWSGYCEGSQCLQYHHEQSANRERIVDGLGNEASYEYDNSGNVTSFTNLRGETTLYEYNLAGDLIRQENPDGGVMTLEYDSRRNLIKQVTPHPADEPAEYFTTSYTYGPLDLVTQVDFPNGASLKMSYDASGNLLRQEDEDGNLLIAFTYGPGGVFTSETNRFGTTTFEDFTPQGAPRKVTDPYGVVTTNTYDEDGNLLTQTDSRYGASYTYDGLGRETEISYSNGLEISNSYGLDEFPLVTESSTGARRERLLSSAGQVRGMRLHNGGRLDYGVDEQGLVEEITRNGGVSTLERDASGRVIAQTDPRGNRISRELDAMGRITSQTNGLGHRMDQTFDVAGRPRSFTNARRHTWSLDYLPNRTTITDPLGRQEVVISNSQGLPIRRELTGGFVEEIEYLHLDPLADPEQSPTKYTDVEGRVTRYSYNTFGNRLTYTNPALEQFQMTWDDSIGRMTSMTGPLGNKRSFTYDSLGELETVEFGDGGILAFATNLVE